MLCLHRLAPRNQPANISLLSKWIKEQMSYCSIVSDSTTLNGTFNSFQIFDLSGKAQWWEKSSIEEVASSNLRSEHLGRRTKENFGLPAAAVRLFHSTEERGLQNLYSDEMPSFDIEPTVRGEVMRDFWTPKLLHGCSRVWMDKQLDLWKDFQRIWRLWLAEGKKQNRSLFTHLTNIYQMLIILTHSWHDISERE